MSTLSYDLELPFLVELEERVRVYAEQTEARAAPPTEPMRPIAHRRSPRRSAARAARRTAILVALLCLLGATAYGTRAAFFTNAPGPRPPQSRAVTLAGGRAGADIWTLRVYARAGQLCDELIVLSQQESSRCVPPPKARAVETASLTSAAHGYLFGIAGAGVGTVAVREGRTSFDVATQPLGGSGRVVGAPSATRYFLAVLPRPTGQGEQRVTLTGLDDSHRPVGQPRVSCVGAAQPTCSG